VKTDAAKLAADAKTAEGWVNKHPAAATTLLLTGWTIVAVIAILRFIHKL
jgi:hypothetical protein